MDEELRSFKESYEKVSEENKELVTKLSNYRNNVLNETVNRDAVGFISRHGEHEVVEKMPMYCLLVFLLSRMRIWG